MGIHVAAHAHGDEGIYSATKAGIDTIEHGSFISDESIRLMKEKMNYLIPTQTSAFIDKPEVMKKLPKEVIEKTSIVDKAMFERHKIAFQKGVKIALGTDAGVPGNPHGFSAREITSMVEKVGMSATQALQCATIEAARAIKLDGLIGSLEPGKLADLVVVNGLLLDEPNNITNIKALEDNFNISFVIKNGRVLAKKGKLLDFLNV
jgi:imidazolonepropionase-like amidohydrolase